MENDERIVKVAVNPNFSNKIPRDGNTRFFSEEWTNGEFTVEDFITIIKNGWAYCSQLKGTRKKENYLLSNIVSIDIDSGHKIDEILEDDFIKKHLSILYTTTNHTIDDHRFRLIFICEDDIEDSELQRRINQALTYKFEGDRASTDPARPFFGNTESNPMTFSGMLTKPIILELIELGNTPPSDQLFNQKGISTYSKFTLDPSQIVKDINGKHIALKDIVNRVSIYCPFHYDKNPSAFVKREDDNPAFIHCKTCNQTWWEKSPLLIDYRNKVLPDFVDTLKKRDTFIANNLRNEDFLLRKFKADDDFVRSRINFSNNRYVQLPEIHSGITFIKSPKGSGKTTTLSEVMLPLLSRFKTIDEFQDFEEYELAGYDIPRSRDSDYRVLLIGHRQALIRNLCNRLKLHCYLDDENTISRNIPKRLLMKRYGVCLDSLWRVKGYDFDLIIIDESEQVLSHFLSSTMDKREWNYQLLEAMIYRTPSVIALDADLSWISYLSLCKMKKHHSITDSKDNQSWIYINEYKVPDEIIEIYDSKNHLISLLNKDILENKRVFVTSNSKKTIDYLYSATSELLSNGGKAICITSENSKADEIQNFINNIKTTAKEYQAIFCSPSLGTGVDISFEYEVDAVDCVYGIFEADITTHKEIDQQLARVRDPKKVRCYISKRRFNYETNFDVVQTDLLVNHIVANTSLGFDPITHEELFNYENDFLSLASLIISDQRESKNNLYENFINHKRDNGFNCIIIIKDEEISAVGSDFIKEGKLLYKKENIERLMTSFPINKNEYDNIYFRLDSNEWIEQDLIMSYNRIGIEKFYCEVLSNELIELDNGGRFRKRIKMFERITDEITFNEIFKLKKLKKQSGNILEMKILPDNEKACVLIHDLLASAGIYKNYTFLTDVEYSSLDLKKFINLSIEYKNYQEGLLGINVQSNIHEKPTEHLSKILKFVGLKQRITRREENKNKRTNFYKIDKERFDRVISIIDKRKQYAENPWNFIYQIYGNLLQDLNDTPLIRNSYEQIYKYDWGHPLERTGAENKAKRRNLKRRKTGVIENIIPNNVARLPIDD